MGPLGGVPGVSLTGSFRVPMSPLRGCSVVSVLMALGAIGLSLYWCLHEILPGVAEIFREHQGYVFSEG